MTTLLFAPGRLKLTLDDVRAAVQTNQLDALLRIVSATVGPEGVRTVEGAAKLLMAKRRSHLRLIRGGRGTGNLSKRLTAFDAPLATRLESVQSHPVSTHSTAHGIESKTLRMMLQPR